MPRSMTAMLTAALTLAWTGSAGAADIYAKAGATAAEQAAAVKDCVAKADKAPVDYDNTYVYASSPAALIAVAIVGGVMQGVHESREHRRFEDRCMRKAGWARLKLNDAEEAAYAKARAD